MRREIGLVVVFTISLATPGFAALVSPDCISIKASVTVPIARGDLDASRQLALAEVRRESLKTALSTKLLDVATFQQSAAAIDKAILQAPDAYLARCEIESEDVVNEGQSYQMVAAAEVRQAALKATLADLGIVDPVALADKPRVMVLIRERFETRVSGTRYCETLLASQLQAKGFKVVDADQKKLLDQRERVFAEATGDRGALFQSATAFPADYLLVGEVAVTSSGPLAGSDLKARFANLSLKMVETTSGTVLATITSEGRSRHIDELTGGNWAMEDALKVASPDLLNQFKEALKKQLVQGAPITIDFYGLDQPSQRQQAQALMQRVDRVAGVTRRFFVPGVCQFEVRFKGPASELAAELQKLSVEGQPVEVTEAGPRYLRLSRGAGSVSVKAGAESALTSFAVEKFKDFDQEKLREANKEVIAQITELAKNSRVNDEQRKQLFAARKEIEQKEKDLAVRQQELAERRKELKTAEADLVKSRVVSAQAQQPSTHAPGESARASVGSSVPSQTYAASPVSTSPTRTQNYAPQSSAAQASQRSYVASRNVANAQTCASTAVADDLSALQEGLTAINTVASGVDNTVSTVKHVESTIRNVGALLGGGKMFGF